MKKILLVLLVSLLFFSCVPQRKLVYVQSESGEKDYEYLRSGSGNVRIQPYDQLYVSIGSMDQHEFNFFEQSKPNFASPTDATISLQAYTVTDSGTIKLPVVGKIKVQGLRLDEAESVITDSCKNKLNGPIVSVKYVNNNITILGEVLRAGTYTFNKEQLTIFRAIGLAGDIGEYGNRKKVAILRERGNKVEKHYVDLTQESIFKSEFYYLRPNDVVYVEPLKIRRFGMKEYPFTLIVSAVTSAFLILYYVKK